MAGEHSDKKERAARFFGQLASPSFGQEVPLFLAMGKGLVELAESTYTTKFFLRAQRARKYFESGSFLDIGGGVETKKFEPPIIISQLLTKIHF